MCGEPFSQLQPLDNKYPPLHLMDNPADVMSCALCCDAGHEFCVQCWSSHVLVQVKEGQAHYLGCPGYRCGERLPVTWAPVLLHQHSELVTQLRDRRVRRPVDCSLRMRWCRRPECGHAIRFEATAALSATGSSTEGLPHTMVCNGCGTSFCDRCEDVGHAPCSCAVWAQWKAKVAEEMQAADHLKAGLRWSSASSWCKYCVLPFPAKRTASSFPFHGHICNAGSPRTAILSLRRAVVWKDANDIDVANAMWVAANTKKCPRCQTPIEKNEVTPPCSPALSWALLPYSFSWRIVSVIPL